MPHIFYFQVYFLEFCSYLWNLGKAPLKHHPLCLCFHHFSHAEQSPISQGSYNILNLPLLFRSYNKSYSIIIFWIYPCYLLSRSWWWTGKPCVLQSMGSQRVRDDWVTELNWTDCCYRFTIICFFFQLPSSIPYIVIWNSNSDTAHALQILSS